MDERIRLLHLEDNLRDAELLRDQLECDGLSCDIQLAQDEAAFEAALDEPWDIVVCDYNLPGYDGMAALARSRERQPGVPVILLSGSMRPEDAVACMRAGASDYVFKDRPERLAVSIKRALGNVAERRARERAEQALRENEERLRLATEAAALEAWELDLAANRIHASARTRAELGMSDEAAPWSFDQWLLGIHPDDREMARRALIDTIRDGTPYHLEYRMTTSAGEIWVAVWGSLTHDASGRPQRLLGVWQNISARKAAEEEVLRSLQEKEALLREVHHRVNNNLQVIASLLRLEARRVVDPAVQESLGSMRNRIHAMAILHQTLYRSGRYAEVALGSYLQEVAGNVARSFATTAHAVEVKTSLSNVPLNVDQAIPCGLIVNELVTNSLKHGFPGGRAGTVTVSLEETGLDSELLVRVSDTGIGLPADADLASRREHSLGLQLVSDLASQLRGSLRSVAGPGMTVELRFVRAPLRFVPEPALDRRTGPFQIP